jgi:hypothetical protein
MNQKELLKLTSLTPLALIGAKQFAAPESLVAEKGKNALIIERKVLPPFPNSFKNEFQFTGDAGKIRNIVRFLTQG